MNKQLDLERKSSAVTLSDMEIFVFPDLIYSLVLANIMSPLIWQWRNDPWFLGIENMNPYKRILRLKQYIMNNYCFNLDLDTWGLTTQDKELARFNSFIDSDMLKKSNALFGYEGDAYYFDVNIRKHFGLDKYKNNVIPYWKTETVEAMNAFIYKEGFETAAGECVSLSTLYAASLFIVARIPLSDIYLTATPLHSQNFINIRNGILTNNRRLVTKNMWINGTEISAKARRALENEQVTIVAHETGYIHTLYAEATINQKMYHTFADKLTSFTQTPLTSSVLGNFIRYRRDLQKCFQIRWHIRGHDYYIEAERVFSYESYSSYLFTSQNRKYLMNDIEIDEFHTDKIPSRIIFNDLEEYVNNNTPELNIKKDIDALRERFESDCLSAAIAIEELIKFCITKPNIPSDSSKTFISYEEPLNIIPSMERDDIINRLESIRKKNLIADLAFFAYRDLRKTEVEPFLIAAINRNPVSIEGTKDYKINETINLIQSFLSESIYPEGGRIAQPDEVWNYKRGDGIEKALLLANIINYKNPSGDISISVSHQVAVLKSGNTEIKFPSTKNLPEQVWRLSNLFEKVI